MSLRKTLGHSHDGGKTVILHNTTHIQIFQVTSFGFVKKPSLDLFLYRESSRENLAMHIRLRSQCFAMYVIKFNEIMYK